MVGGDRLEPDNRTRDRLSGWPVEVSPIFYQSHIHFRIPHTSVFYPARSYTETKCPSMDSEKVTREILEVLRTMNRCWTEGWHEEQFRQYILPDAVAIVPRIPGRLEGREEYIAGWREFATSATIHEWNESCHSIQVYARGTCAVVTYLFTIRFTSGGKYQSMHGRDMFFLVRQGGRWQVAADQFSPEPSVGGQAL